MATGNGGGAGGNAGQGGGGGGNGGGNCEPELSGSLKTFGAVLKALREEARHGEMRSQALSHQAAASLLEQMRGAL
ncbi:hypothetical protein ACWG5P_25260 [Streptomyces prasinus]